jgi:hypothetical protein
VNLKLIDNNHFYLSPKQAAELSSEGRVPRHGYEIKADPTKFAGVTLTKWSRCHDDWVPCERQIGERGAWILRTPLTWWDGKAVDKGYVFALHVL